MTVALVTGAPGWLGTRLVESLVHGLPDVPDLRAPMGERTVRCLVRRGTDASELSRISPRVQIAFGDLTDGASLDAFIDGAKDATLFHCAGVIHPTAGTREWTEVNVEGTHALLERAKKGRVRRFVHVSSNSPIGTNRSPGHVFDESSPYHPYMGYGKSKKIAEELVNAAGEGGAIEPVIIRPPWFYGPGQPPRQTLFFQMIKDGKAPLVGSGENRRSMAYVDNICQGLLLCERVERAKGQTFWIADRVPYAMKDILDTIERVLENDFGLEVAHRRTRLPGFVSDVARLADRALQAIGVYHQKLHVLGEMNQSIACSIAKAERELGYDPKIDLAEGIRRSLAWMKARGLELQ